MINVSLEICVAKLYDRNPRKYVAKLYDKCVFSSVGIPYKADVLKFCDELDHTAEVGYRAL
jgi:shikimate 5-dehydrogenase